MTTYYSADFETSVYNGQTSTEVWASAIVELYTENVIVENSINKFVRTVHSLKNEKSIIYFHNLAFDGTFLLTHYLDKLKFNQAYTVLEKEPLKIDWLKDKDMPNKSIKYSINDNGKWFSITVKVNDHIIEYRDSYKLIPLSVKSIGKSFKTKHQKLDIEYEGFRKANGMITKQERDYIANDVLVVKEALEQMFEEGHDKLTIGSCCMNEFKKEFYHKEYKMMFPNLQEIELDKNLYGSDNVDAYIRKTYRGGWCYVNQKTASKIVTNGLTADVNSLYPSVMHSDSGNWYCVGKPRFWKGNFIPNEVKQCRKRQRYYFLRIRTKFKLKPGKLPFIQIKGTCDYKNNEYLEQSGLYSYVDHKYYDYVYKNGEVVEVKPTLSLTKTDYELFMEHYDLIEPEILDGCYFDCELGLFDSYINKYREIKMKEKGGKRTIAKLFLNNLYGKLASNDNSSFKLVEIKDGVIFYKYVECHDKHPGYIAIGSQVTSYAKNFTIRAGQSNYKNFAYSDTDSIHLYDIKLEDVKGVPVHDNAFNHWKIETFWDKALFLRQKTYIEHITHADMVKLEKPYFMVKCAGLGSWGQYLVNRKLQNKPLSDEEKEKFDYDEQIFLSSGMDMTDFAVGLRVPGDLSPKRIKGGILLQKGYFEIR